MNLEYIDLMPTPKGRIATWFPITLAVTGSFALLVGIFVAVLSIPEVVVAGHPRLTIPQQTSMYVGANTCYTCHADRPWDRSLTLYTQTIVDAPEKPKAVTELAPDIQVQQINVDEMVEAYTTADTVASWQDPAQQHYLIKTEDGGIVHPAVSTNSKSDDAVSQCATCHTMNAAQSLTRLPTINIAMVIEPIFTNTRQVVIYQSFNRQNTL